MTHLKVSPMSFENGDKFFQARIIFLDIVFGPFVKDQHHL